MFSLLPPPRRRLRGGGRRGNEAWTARRHLIFRKNPPGAALLRESTCSRMVATAAQRLPRRGLPQCGDSRIHWGLIRPYDAQTEFGEHVFRPRDHASRHNSVANLVWQRAEARNRSRAREPDAPSVSYPHHRSEVIDRPWSWALQPRASTIQPSPSDPHHRATQPPRHTEPRDHRASRYILEHPAPDRKRHSTVPLAPTSRAGITASVLLRRPHEAETSQFTLSRTPTRRMPKPARVGPTLLHARLPAELKMLSRDTASRSAPEFPEPPHGHYELKQDSTNPSEPHPSTSRDQTYAWPPTPRDFDNDRAVSLASTKDEPDYSSPPSST